MLLHAEVFDRTGQLDELLTARLNAVLEQPTPQQLLDLNTALDSALGKAAQQVLPGIERRVDIERVSKLSEDPRYRARVTLFGRAAPDTLSAPDPVENTDVREEW
jgi:hypothetical protein